MLGAWGKKEKGGTSTNEYVGMIPLAYYAPLNPAVPETLALLLACAHPSPLLLYSSTLVLLLLALPNPQVPTSPKVEIKKTDGLCFRSNTL